MKPERTPSGNPWLCGYLSESALAAVQQQARPALIDLQVDGRSVTMFRGGRRASAKERDHDVPSSPHQRLVTVATTNNATAATATATATATTTTNAVPATATTNRAAAAAAAAVTANANAATNNVTATTAAAAAIHNKLFGLAHRGQSLIHTKGLAKREGMGEGEVRKMRDMSSASPTPKVWPRGDGGRVGFEFSKKKL